MSVKFKAIEKPLDGVVVIEPTVFGDARGFFMETFAERDFQELGIKERFVQDNHSKSHRGVIRGLHFQTRNTQGKLVRVVAGSAYDVAVDLRPESSTFGKWFGTVISAENRRQMYIPPRFAHGFLTLEDDTEFLYKCTDYYNAEADGGVIWNDPTVNVNWRLEEFGINPEELSFSEKDSNKPMFDRLDWSKIWE